MFVGDITEINVIRNVNNQLYDDVPKKLTLYISDVYITNIYSLFKLLIIPLMNVQDEGISIIRIPDPHTWVVVDIVNLLFFVATHYKIIKIFKTPWGTKTRYYLMFSELVNVFDNKEYINILNYLETDKSQYHTQESITKVETFIPMVLELQQKLINVEKYEDVSINWIEKIMLYK
jgi:hypothetical protein